MDKNVLLVDDDRISNLLNEKTLARLGIAKEVHTALNGKEALELINKYYGGGVALPDIIFLDLNMPIMDGFQFIEAFQKLGIDKTSSIMIIIVTSSNDPRDRVRAKSLGIDNYLTKPVREEDLLKFCSVN
jgi:CheY-like chemotaxis protein